jgi:hypothetical protein
MKGLFPKKLLLIGVVWVSLLFRGPVGGAAEPAQTWPQWHGPTRDCLVSGADWPKSLDKYHLKLQWHVDLGPGYPGPIVLLDSHKVSEEETWGTWPCAVIRCSSGN